MKIATTFTYSMSLLLALCWMSAVQANESQRQKFVEALGLVETGRNEAEDFSALRDYVLYPYLQAAELQRSLRRSPGNYTDQRVEAFLERHGEAVFTRGLRALWLRRLAEREEWRTLLAYYPQRAGEETQCHGALARTKTRADDAEAIAQSLWLTGSMRHKSCIPVFDWLEKQGGLSAKLIDDRVSLAIDAANVKLVRSLVSRQIGAQRARTEHWLWAYKNPRDSMTRLASNGDAKMDAAMLGQVFRRLATRDRKRAAELYERVMQRSGVDQTLRQQLAAFIGFRHILNREPEALDWYRRSGTVALRSIESEWRIRSAIYASAWKDVLIWIDALSADQQATPRWQYWRGRALQALGESSAARQAFSSISQKRDFYAFLAADRLNEKYGIIDRPVVQDGRVQARIKARGETLRAYELWKAGLADKARSEWSALLDALPAEEQLQAGVLADEWGWWARAITSYGRGGYWDDLARRFPAPYRSIFTKQVERQGIERSWAYAITRSESMFAHDARSPVGALGLMQLMPATARQVARSEGIKWLGTAMLYQPAHNIRLGVRYLSDMRKKFGGHIAMATAAYNAGPHNVNKWRPSRDLPADIWIETVPFGATHNYLRHVLEFMATYEWRLTGDYQRLSDRLPVVKGR